MNCFNKYNITDYLILNNNEKIIFEQSEFFLFKKHISKMEESTVLWMLSLVMLIGSCITGSLPLVMNLSEVISFSFDDR